MALRTFLEDPRSKRFYLNRARRFVQPYVLGIDTQADYPQRNAADTGDVSVRAVRVPNGGLSAPKPTTVSQEGPFEGFALAHTRRRSSTAGASGTGALNERGLLVKITDDAGKRALMNDWVHCDAILGSAAQPFVLPQTMMLEERRSLIWQFRDAIVPGGVTADIYVYPVILGRRFYRQSAPPGVLDRYVGRMIERQQVSIPYFLVPDELRAADSSIQLAASERYRTLTFTVDNTGHFDWHKTVVIAEDAENIDMEIRDPESRRALSNGFMWASNVAATGEWGAAGTWSQLQVPGGTNYVAGLTPATNPAIWPEPLFCTRRMRVEIVVNNYANATNRVWITLIGRKIFATEGAL